MALNSLADESSTLNQILEIACFKIGERPHIAIRLQGNSGFMARWDEIVGQDFEKCLYMTEAVHSAIWALDRYNTAKALANGIVTALEMSEVDLEIDWNGTIFTRKGAKLLDDKLVNDPLHWLREKKYENVLKPFEKGLKHWMEVHKDTERCGDVVTDMYEALEALAKIVTGRESELAGNREKFAAELRLPEQYNRMLKEYIDFGCKYRHSPEVKTPRTYPSPNETEAFLYLTGVFIRFAVS